MAVRNDYEVAEAASVRELYNFYVGDRSWFDYYYTNRDQTFTFAGKQYLPLQIQRNNIRQTVSSISNTVEIVVPRDNPISRAFMLIPPHGGINIDLLIGYDEDLGAITDPENLFFWKGVVINASWKGNQCTLTCESKFKVLDRVAIRRRANVRCPYALYDANSCKVSKTASARRGVVASITNPTSLVVNEDFITGGTWENLALNAIYDYQNHYSGGFAEYTSEQDNAIYRVGILSGTFNGINSGTESSVTLTLDQELPGVLVGSSLLLYPGCARNTDHCHNKYNNYLNFGGIPHLTTDDPFSIAYRTPLQ